MSKNSLEEFTARECARLLIENTALGILHIGAHHGQEASYC
jgi:hypothetical protein